MRINLAGYRRSLSWFTTALGIVFLASGNAALAQQPWPVVGGDIHNSGAVLSPSGPGQLSPSKIGRLKLKWQLATGGDVSATPTVEPGAVYFPDWGGYLSKVDPETGAVIWRHKISEWTGDPNSISRGSPAITGNALVFGDRSIARVIAIDKNTAQKLWVTRVDDNPNAMVSSSAVVYGGLAYLGVASREEITVNKPPPTFRGSAVALDVRTGTLAWKFATVPPGYTGGGVVGAPVIDEQRRSVYIASDNNYTIPVGAEACVKQAGTAIDSQLACLDPADYVDAVLALDLKTGALKWSRRFQGADTWMDTCHTQSGCPQPPGLDFDFASAPNLFRVNGLAGTRDDRGGTSDGWILGIGQKSGTYRAISPGNGGVYWSTLVGLGGIQWGSAVDLDDHGHIYVAVKNDSHSTNTLTDYRGRTRSWNAGSWNALDARTGAIVWQTPATGYDLRYPSFGASAPGALTFTNYVVFAGASSGYMTAIDAQTGVTLWSFKAGGTVTSAPAIFNDVVYWGTGYARIGVGNHMFYAFALQ